MLYAITILVLVVCFVFLIFYIMELREWNNGICADTQMPWKAFDVASDGSTGYTDGMGNYIWISYPFVTRRKIE